MDFVAVENSDKPAARRASCIFWARPILAFRCFSRRVSRPARRPPRVNNCLSAMSQYLEFDPVLPLSWLKIQRTQSQPFRLRRPVKCLRTHRRAAPRKAVSEAQDLLVFGLESVRCGVELCAARYRSESRGKAAPRTQRSAFQAKPLRVFPCAIEVVAGFVKLVAAPRSYGRRLG
jgi:hypothetical protein